jgi:hypothetical protein
MAECKVSDTDVDIINDRGVEKEFSSRGTNDIPFRTALLSNVPYLLVTYGTSEVNIAGPTTATSLSPTATRPNGVVYMWCMNDSRVHAWRYLYCRVTLNRVTLVDGNPVALKALRRVRAEMVLKLSETLAGHEKQAQKKTEQPQISYHQISPFVPVTARPLS